MYISELYTLYSLARKLIDEDKYEVLHINHQTDEMWLKKTHRRKATILRLSNRGFNWKNELKSDMARTFKVFESFQHRINSREIHIHNIYISTYPPVDTWEMLKEPVHFRKRKNVSMNMYYISEENKEDELQRLARNIQHEGFEMLPKATVDEQESFVHMYKTELHTSIKREQERIRKILFFGKPKLVYILIALNVFYYFVIEFNGGSTDPETLIQYGAKYNPLIMEGEWWRIITSMFMHIGFFHLAMNMLALYYLGIAVEQIFGSKRYVFMYMFAGIGAGIASFALTTSISAGASGAIFGMFGVLLYFGLIHKKLFFQTMGSSILVIVVLNLIFGFTVPMVDNSAHVGGLITGFLAAAIIQLPQQKNNRIRTLGTLATIIGLGGLLWFGFTNESNMTLNELNEIERMQERHEYDEVIDRTTNLLSKSDTHAAQLLFQRSYAYIMILDYDKAQEDLEEVIKIEETMIPEAYYNLALLHLEVGEEDLAIERVTRAYELQPANEDIEELYNRIVE